jgi:hypothetical protein
MTPTLADAIHLVHGDSAALTLQTLGARTVLVRRDLLTVGPCDVDPEKHRALREQFWGAPPVTPSGLPGVDADDDLRRELRAAGGQPVVIWASSAWSDLPFLWCLLDALVRIGADRPWLVRPAGDDPTVSVGGIAADRVRSSFDGMERLSDAVGRSCIAFWHAYADPSPIAFDELRVRGARMIPELDRMLAGHAAWFPWQADAGVQLADADRAVFDWADTAQLDRVRHLLHWMGDTSLFARVAAWQERGALAGESRAPSLTDAGRRLRDAGATSVAELPSLWVGGCRVNDPKSPWLRVRTTDGWRLARG